MSGSIAIDPQTINHIPYELTGKKVMFNATYVLWESCPFEYDEGAQVTVHVQRVHKPLQIPFRYHSSCNAGVVAEVQGIVVRNGTLHHEVLFWVPRSNTASNELSLCAAT